MADTAVDHAHHIEAPSLSATARDGLRVSAAALVCGAAVLLFAVHVRPWGYVPLLAGVALAWMVDRFLARDLTLIAVGQIIISTISLKADLSNAGIARFAAALGLAVLVPYALSRWVLRDHAIRFPMRGGWPWTRAQWAYIAVVVVAGYLILPYYFIGSGVYQNWPEVTGAQEIGRLFVGVNAVGIWDELFFVATVFTLLLRHFPVWLANGLQAIVFVSFLWELGYREWGPVLTVPFALIQGWIFSWARSLPYVVTVHLLFDAVVFGVLVHAHHPDLLDIFVTAP
ncbi:CPBP family intramembrane metalloprotease [Demequina sp. TTPB684]|uniref:CPBP family intramembrane glutamic endopeptidase n=1 Tax=unclassified Demequina TaxID=2620311 RepID=UPI001CF5A8D4|nr:MULTISPECIES: CPBP family intramembrane glutamic endopeptidase [unclassified Demequina]MCB2412018.1 CPBP family intramembrane metalloprotease [Demequina sp. TTPB684]UPU88815.1 CPBP family intramembrane metalloprotease [Demequina sp. TMPB413]